MHSQSAELLAERVSLPLLTPSASLSQLLVELECRGGGEDEVNWLTRSRCSAAAELISVLIVSMSSSVVVSETLPWWRCCDIASTISAFVSVSLARSLANSPRWGNKHTEMVIIQYSVFFFVLLVFNGTFSTNRLYRAIEVCSISHRAGRQYKHHAIKQRKNTINQDNQTFFGQGFIEMIPPPRLGFLRGVFLANCLASNNNLTRTTTNEN